MKITKITLFFVLCQLIIICSCNFRNEDSQKGNLNKSNSQKINLGMDKIDVVSIMGKPDSISTNKYLYNTFDDSYPFIEFRFDSLGKVNKIFTPIRNKH